MAIPEICGNVVFSLIFWKSSHLHTSALSKDEVPWYSEVTPKSSSTDLKIEDTVQLI